MASISFVNCIFCTLPSLLSALLLRSSLSSSLPCPQGSPGSVASLAPLPPASAGALFSRSSSSSVVPRSSSEGAGATVAGVVGALFSRPIWPSSGPDTLRQNVAADTFAIKCPGRGSCPLPLEKGERGRARTCSTRPPLLFLCLPCCDGRGGRGRSGRGEVARTGRGQRPFAAPASPCPPSVSDLCPPPSCCLRTADVTSQALLHRPFSRK